MGHFRISGNDPSKEIDMTDIDTTPPPAGKVRLNYFDLWDREPDFTLRATELVEAKSALTHLLHIADKCIYGFHSNPTPTRVVIGGGGFNKWYRDEMIGSAADLQPVYDFAKVYNKIRLEDGAATKISIAFEKRVRAKIEDEAKQLASYANRDSASARRGRRGVSNGPATPLNWRLRMLLGHSTLKCALLESLGALNEEWFPRLGGMKNETLIELLDLKIGSPNTSLDELLQLAA